jgi:copper chaperone NosL
VLAAACRLPDGPQPIAYDREACAHCRMLIGDPHFAAQLQTQDGEVRSYDDPGCLIADLTQRAPRVHALWFHHLREERWLDGDHVGFVETARSPMGYRLGAVEAGAPGALSLAEAGARVAARRETRP